MSQRLRGPRELVLPTTLTVLDASAQVRRALAERASVELEAGATTDRRLVGSMDGATAHLSVRDEHFFTRRMNWGLIEFHGRFNESADGVTLEGAIDIPDRRDLDRMMWVFRIAAAVIAIFALAIIGRELASGASVTIWSVIGALALFGGIVAGSFLVKADGERAAGEDAEQLTEFLTRMLASAGDRGWS